MAFHDLKLLLDNAVARYNTPAFIANDPISLPHSFTTLQDREIIGFWAATLAWGQRKTIINNALRLVELMDGAPHDFIKITRRKIAPVFWISNTALFRPPIHSGFWNFCNNIIVNIPLWKRHSPGTSARTMRLWNGR